MTGQGREEGEEASAEDTREAALPRHSYRFAREVSGLAPKPGHHLGTMSVEVGGRMALLYIIEGAANNAVSLVGFVTDFTQTALLSFHLAGTIAVLDSFPYTPESYGEVLEFSNGSMTLDTNELGWTVTKATVIYSRVRSVTGRDPDGGAIKIDQTQGGPIFASFSGFKEGWVPALVAGVVVAVGYGLYKLADKALDKIGENLEHVKIKAKASAGPVNGDLELEFGKGPSQK